VSGWQVKNEAPLIMWVYVQETGGIRFLSASPQIKLQIVGDAGVGGKI
jgi:hypothetical protein